MHKKKKINFNLYYVIWQMNGSQGQSDNIGNNSGNESANSSNQSDEAPLWSYVEKVAKAGAGGTWKFKCSFCNLERQGSYSRVKAHLLGIKNLGISSCTKIRMNEKLELQRLENEFETRKKESGPKEVSLACETDPAFKKRKSALSPIERAFGVQARDQLDQEIARMFYPVSRTRFSAT